MNAAKEPATRGPRKHKGGGDSKVQPGNPAARPVVPDIPNESGVGEEDPGDFENASIRSDDGLRITPKPRGE